MNRGTYWSDNEMKALIAIWGASDLQQQLDGAVRNKVIYEKIAQEMKKKEYERDWTQCRIKIKNLKTNYKKVKDSNNKTGERRKTCKFYDELDRILGHRPASAPSFLVDTSSEMEERVDEIVEDTDGTIIIMIHLILILNLLTQMAVKFSHSFQWRVPVLWPILKERPVHLKRRKQMNVSS